MDEAEAALAGLPEDKAGDPAIAKAKAGIALAKDAAPVDDFDALLAEVAASQDDHEKRFALAAGHVARGDRDAAADALLEKIGGASCRERGCKEWEITGDVGSLKKKTKK